jgi:type VI protein secretion system component VasK
VAAVTFEQRTGPAPNTAFEGPWAWFKLYESGGPVSVSSDTFRLRFTKGSNYAEVLLNAGSVRNPFGSLGALRSFRCRP